MPGRRLHLPITTERLVLRDLRPGDLDAMHAYASHSDVTRFLFWGAIGPEILRYVQESAKMDGETDSLIKLILYF